MRDHQHRSTFEMLVVEHHMQLRAFVRSLAVDPDWVDDISQEAFLIAYREWKSFDATRDFGKWLRGIAANIVRNEFRKDARRQRILHTDLVDVLLTRYSEWKELSEPVTVEAVRECLDKLPPRHREVIQARYRDGQPAPAVARRFETSADAVRQLLVRIRLQLRQCVELRVARVQNG
jgi:RNA polymerase sigma-70 factor (ECF subfamily)